MISYSLCRDYLQETDCGIGVFCKWSGTFIEFRESEESLKHVLLPVSLWFSGQLCLLHKRSPVPTPQSSFLIFLSLNSENSVKTFRENSIESSVFIWQLTARHVWHGTSFIRQRLKTQWVISGRNNFAKNSCRRQSMQVRQARDTH